MIRCASISALFAVLASAACSGKAATGGGGSGTAGSPTGGGAAGTVGAAGGARAGASGNAGGATGAAGLSGTAGSIGATDAGTDAPTDAPTDVSVDVGSDAIVAPTVAACSPGVFYQVPFTDGHELSCNKYGWEYGIPNGEAVYAKTFILPKPLVPGADNALSFDLTGAGPFDFELWGGDTTCAAEELLWWGPFGAGTQCAQFRPSKAFPYILFVQRKMYKESYSFGTPSATMCPGGTCPSGTTGAGKLTDVPLSSPVGNYVLHRFDQRAGGWDVGVGVGAKYGDLTLVWKGDVQKHGTAQPLAAGVFRMPATDPFGDAWYCVGEGSTLTQIDDGSFLKKINFSLRGITRLGDCGDVPGTASLSATINQSTTSGTYYAADVAGSISSWLGTNLPANLDCGGATCSLRFRGVPQQHYLRVTTAMDLTMPPTTAVPVTWATWLLQPSGTEPFQMTCATEGSFLYQPDGTSKLQLAKVASPRSCPGTPIPNDSLAFTADD